MFMLQWLWVFFVRLVLIITGLVVVPLALPFSDWGLSVSDGRPIMVLPRWAWLWDNDFDGSKGDKRGWWAANTPFGLGADHWLSKFVWLAIRNPANNFRRTKLGSCPVSECYVYWLGDKVVADRPGSGGMQFVEAMHAGTGQKWFGFYWVKEWSSTRALVVRLGYKVTPAHDLLSNEPPKGITFKINPWKAL